MTRQIKFRAWDKTLKEMAQVSKIEFDDGGKLVGASLGTSKGSIGVFNPRGTEELFALMQSTGLLDSKSREIYEGDVVEFEEPRFEVKMVKGEVVFIDGTFGFEAEGFFYPFRHFIEKFDEGYEILGNIFENPSLLPKDN